jgi:hypothetical protein
MWLQHRQLVAITINVTIKRPAWTVFKSVGKVGEIERHLIAKDTKRTKRDQGACQSEETALRF